MKQIVENYIQFMQSASIVQDPRAYDLYGANPTIGRKTQAKKLINRLKSPRHQKNLMRSRSRK